MEVITLVGQWIINCAVSLWRALGTWGVIGFGIIIIPILAKLTRLMRKFINF